ncbi:16S rRNA (guanine(966)-N(2))-methyltransferase RsmD [Psychrobacter sp. GP33]|uniref:16S rRNA (guanine(966)-N(2))-methyltransferase RsmD n=1 Tax=Psychrobacter sp. GP33 TaxID=2758709 RepID=UPI0015F8E159|nr:16S rRNA (guanine(966)-N(2))-methyltransferase RsmD [Psychrobacter sp. GP33]
MKKLSASSSKNSKKNAVSQVRIIGGQHKRRTVSFIDANGLRPTPDRLRETIFNWLLMDIHDARVLDSCAGSGVLGFEALSRGAAHCTFIEANRLQAEQLNQSGEQLRLEPNSYKIIYGAAEQVLEQNASINTPFNIIFIDPPYAQDLWQPILTALISRALINADTLIYLEADKELTQPLAELAVLLQDTLSAQGLTTFDCIKHTKVGQVVAGLYRLTSS